MKNMWEKSDDDGRGGEEKEKKTEAEVDGQFECGLQGDVTVGGRDAKPGCVEANGQKHRPLHRSMNICDGRRTRSDTALE